MQRTLPGIARASQVTLSHDVATCIADACCKGEIWQHEKVRNHITSTAN
jgi:hypothetical protein